MIIVVAVVAADGIRLLLQLHMNHGPSSATLTSGELAIRVKTNLAQ
jgi:hypothetical protein